MFTVLRESNHRVLPLLLTVCAPYRTKACRDSLSHSVRPEALEPRNAVVLLWVATEHQVLRPQVEKANGEAWPSEVKSSATLCFLLWVVCRASEF